VPRVAAHPWGGRRPASVPRLGRGRVEPPGPCPRRPVRSRGRSYAEDIVVHWPDGHTTTGIERHIGDLKQMFVFAPDNRIRVHPVKFGTGPWTAVTG
jgi:hypothetical protein